MWRFEGASSSFLTCCYRWAKKRYGSGKKLIVWGSVVAIRDIDELPWGSNFILTGRTRALRMAITCLRHWSIPYGTFAQWSAQLFHGKRVVSTCFSLLVRTRWMTCACSADFRFSKILCAAGLFSLLHSTCYLMRKFRVSKIWRFYGMREVHVVTLASPPPTDIRTSPHTAFAFPSPSQAPQEGRPWLLRFVGSRCVVASFLPVREEFRPRRQGTVLVRVAIIRRL